MTIYTFSRQSSADELAAEMDRRGEVIEALEATITSLRAELERKDAALREAGFVANHAGELANLRATNERLGWAVESAAVVFEQVYGNAELAEKVRAAALTATQEKGNG